MASPVIVLTPLFPAMQRAILVAFGGVFILLACLGAADRSGWPPHDLFMSLELIPFLIGTALVVSALVDYAIEWRIAPDDVTVLRRSVFTSHTIALTKASVASAVVRTHEWDTRPTSYDVEVRTTDGKRLTTPERTTLADAEQDLAAIAANLPG